MNNQSEELKALTAKHGMRVRRREAMEILCIHDRKAFKKIVDANPAMKHKLNGEGQTRYLTAVIFTLLAARCAKPGAGN